MNYNDITSEELERNMNTGVNWGAKPRITWRSSNGRYFIASIAGNTGYVNRVTGSKYQKAQHFLCDLSRIENCGPGVYWSDTYRTVLKIKISEQRGRLTKEKRAAWIVSCFTEVS